MGLLVVLMVCNVWSLVLRVMVLKLAVTVGLTEFKRTANIDAGRGVPVLLVEDETLANILKLLFDFEVATI